MVKEWKLLYDGTWNDGAFKKEIVSPYSGEVVGVVSFADEEIIKNSIQSLYDFFSEYRRFPRYKRAEILYKASRLLEERKEKFIESIIMESGKVYKYAKGEVERAIENLRFCAEEVKQLRGEVVPMDSSKGGEGRFGYYLRIPRGVIVAITPFNFPLNLVIHKVAPAVGSGNCVLLKPASQTPITAIKFVELLIESGLPTKAISVLPSNGSVAGEEFVKNDRVSMITFTGSPKVGLWINNNIKGIKKVTLELGSNSAMIVDKTANLEYAVKRAVVGSFAFSGQVCISLQRLYIHEEISSRFEELFREEVLKLKVGDPRLKDTDVGPMITESEAIRAEKWLEEAVSAGAKVVVGGKREGRIFYPTILTDVKPDMKIMCLEVFAPIVSLVKFRDFEDALKMVNDSHYGLQAGIFTNDLKNAFKAIESLEVGGVIINDFPTFRVDQMPYGGVKMSGTGREGPRYAMEEMTEIKFVSFNLI